MRAFLHLEQNPVDPTGKPQGVAAKVECDPGSGGRGSWCGYADQYRAQSGVG